MGYFITSKDNTVEIVRPGASHGISLNNLIKQGEGHPYSNANYCRSRGTKFWQPRQPIYSEMSYQGWKIHLSAYKTLESMEAVAQRTLPYLLEHRIQHKYVQVYADYQQLGSSNPSQSFKFITIYPNNLASLQRIVFRLSQLVFHLKGPEISSDTRIVGTNIYVRFGVIRGVAGWDKVCIDGRWVRDDRSRLVPAEMNQAQLFRSVTSTHPYLTLSQAISNYQM